MGSARVVYFVLVFVLLNLRFSEANNYRVSWKIPKNPDKLKQWASKMRFLIGDSLDFKYDPKSDSLLQVSDENYKTCNTTNPIKFSKNGDTKIVLDNSGPYYFISGAKGHCQKGEKIRVWVLSAKHSKKVHDHDVSPVTSPAKSPAPSPKHAVSILAHAPAPGSAVRVMKGGTWLILVVVSLVGLV